MDWNWFFSACAQSFAAIVGIVGAFYFSQVFTLRLRLHSNITEAIIGFTKANNLSDKAKCIDFEKINRYIFNLMEDDLRLAFRKKEILAGDTAAEKAQIYYLRFHKPSFEPAKVVVSNLEKLITTFQTQTPSVPIQSPSSILLRGENESDYRHAENLYYEVFEHVRKLENFRTEVSGVFRESYKLMVWCQLALAFLFLVGVIYPLHFLPLSPSLSLNLDWHLPYDFDWNLKYLFLLSVTLCFLGIMLYFFKILKKTLISKPLVNVLENCCDLSFYSEEFSSFRDNLVFLNHKQDDH